MGQVSSAIGVRWRPMVAGLSLVVATGLAVGGCGNSSSSGGSGASVCARDDAAAARAHTPAGAGSAAQPGGATNPAVAPAWTLPGGNLQNTRDVASAINSSNVPKLGVAWTVPLQIPITHTDGAYATTPVVVNGVVYVQDLESNVMAISLATGKILWTHAYNSPNGGPDGVNVASGVVYATTNHAAFALSAATGRQLWIRTLIGNDHEGFDMIPGYDHGTVYVATVPVNPTVGEYLGGGKGILWALNAATGTPEWSWDEVRSLWGKPGTNSGGGQWYPPSRGHPVVIDGGKAGILIELNAQTGRLLWKLPVGVHNGHDHDGLLTEHAKPASHVGLPKQFCLEPGAFGGIETQLASNGSTTYAAVNDTPLPAGTSAPVAIDGDYVIAGAGSPLSAQQQPMIIAYKLGATGKLPDTVGP